jgi:hypothetical protein
VNDEKMMTNIHALSRIRTHDLSIQAIRPKPQTAWPLELALDDWFGQYHIIYNKEIQILSFLLYTNYSLHRIQYNYTDLLLFNYCPSTAPLISPVRANH